LDNTLVDNIDARCIIMKFGIWNSDAVD